MATTKVTKEALMEIVEEAIVRLISNHRSEFDYLVAESKKNYKGTND